MFIFSAAIEVLQILFELRVEFKVLPWSARPYGVWPPSASPNIFPCLISPGLQHPHWSYLNVTSSCASPSTRRLLSPPVDNSFSLNIVMLSSSIPFILLYCRIINSEGAFCSTLSKIAWIPWFYWLFLDRTTIIWPCVIYSLFVVVFFLLSQLCRLHPESNCVCFILCCMSRP